MAPVSNPPFSTAYTFGDIAREYKLTWKVGSKLSAIQELLEQAEKSVVLVKVVTKVIQEGIKYRSKKGDRITTGEIETLISILAKLGYSIPELSDKRFLDSLSIQPSSRIRVDKVKLSDLNANFQIIESNPDSQGRGYELQFSYLIFSICGSLILGNRSGFREKRRTDHLNSKVKRT